jgi:hypothetical protein
LPHLEKFHIYFGKNLMRNGSQMRTVDARATKGWIIKPSELITLSESQPLSLNDRRTMTLLISAGWSTIQGNNGHDISSRELRTKRSQNDRLKASISRLCEPCINVPVQRVDAASNIASKEILRNVPFLAEARWPSDRSGILFYRFHPQVYGLILSSRTWAKLRDSVVRSISGKYSLILYEMVQDRCTLKYKNSETFTLDEIRAALGVPSGHLSTFADLRTRALVPACKAVTVSSEFNVEFHPRSRGGTRLVTGVEMRWRRLKKEEAGGQP